jgi:tetratricopeptide (TPR) repeat protein
VWNFLQSITKFYTDHKEFIDNLLSGGLPTVFISGIAFLWWLKWRNRQRKIPPNLFAFQVISPQSSDLKQQILGGKDDDPLCDRNIRYQQRVEGRNIQRELREQLEANRWLLILGRTGIGKTREALEVAEDYNQQGWTVLFLKTNEWLDIPAKMPAEVDTDRKLLFVIDDLNRKMHRSRVEISPEAEKSPVEKFTVPLQERLLDALTRYEEFCGKIEVRVIATARNESERDFPGEISPWEQLQWEKYPKLWGKFQVYELPQPGDDGVIGVLVETVREAGISSDTTNYSEIASRNDSTFRNVVENLRRIKADNLPLTTKNYRDTLRDTWEGNYKKAVKRYPQAVHIYDAVDLLRQFDISLYDFTIAATARMLAGGNLWQQLRNRWKIRQAMRFLIVSEGILEPRDGQIEAKGYEFDKERYIQRLLPLILRLGNQHQEKVVDSLFNFGFALGNLGRYEDAIASYDEAIKFKPDKDAAWYNRGFALDNLGRFEDAIASYDEAIKFKPDKDAAWYNRGIALRNLGRYEEAIASYDEAIKFKPDLDQAWNNRGNALGNLGRYEDAIASCDEAIKFKPDLDQAWNNRGNALGNLGRYEDAIASWDKALQFKPDLDAAWSKRGIALDNLGQFEDAIASYNEALKIKPDYDVAWDNRGYALFKLDKLEDAIKSYDKAIEINPDYANAFYNRACAYGSLNNIDLALQDLQTAIHLNPEYRETAKTDSDCDSIRNNAQFQALIDRE